MKERNRLFAILLSVVMAISYMPALAFAEAEGDVLVDTAAVEESLDVQPEAEAVEEQPAEEPEAVAQKTAEPEASEVEEDEAEFILTPEDSALVLEPAPEETLETPAQGFGKTDAEIVSARFESHDGNPVKLMDGICGNYMDTGEGLFFYYSLWNPESLKQGDKIIIEYSDGSSLTYEKTPVASTTPQFVNVDNPADVFYLNPSIFSTDDGGQSYDNKWGVGETHDIFLSYIGNEKFSFTVVVETVANPIDSLQFVTSAGQGTKENPIELMDGIDGEMGIISNPDGTQTKYFHYDYRFKDGDILTINYSDGSSERYFYNKQKEAFINNSGSELEGMPYIGSDQGVSIWEPGNDYEGTLIYGGKRAPVYLRTVENPIYWIEYRSADGRGTRDNPIELIEGIDGQSGNKYGLDYHEYSYSYKNGDVITIYYREGKSETYYYNDGAKKFFNIEGQSLDTTGSKVLFIDLIGYDGAWTIGGTYGSQVTYKGGSGVVYFKVIENPVESIEYRSADGSGAEDKPIKLVEGVDGTYQTDEAGNEYFRYKTRHKAGNTITVKYKDPGRESVVYTYEGDGFYDKDHKRLKGGDYWFEQNYNQYEDHWKVGQVYSDTFYCLGLETTVFFTPVENPVKKVEFSRKDGIQLKEGRDAVNSDGGDGTFFLEYRLNYEDGDLLTVTRQDEGETSPSATTYVAVSDPDTDIWYEELKFVKAVNGNTSELDYNDVIYTYDLDWDSDEQTPEKEWKAGETNHWFTVTYNGVTSDQIPVTMLENPVKSFSFSRDGGVVLYEGIDGVNSDGADGQFFKYYLQFKPGDKLNVNTSDDYARVYEAVRDDSTGDIIFVSKTDPEDIIYEDDIAIKSDSDQNDVHWKPNDGVNHKFILSFSGSTCEVPVTLKENPVKTISFYKEGYDAEQPIPLYEGGDYSYKDDDNNYRYVCPLDEGDKLVINEGKTDEIVYIYKRTETADAFFNRDNEKDMIETPWEISWSSEQDGGEEITWKAGDTGVFTLTYMGASCNINVIVAKGGSTDTKPVKMTWAFKGEDLPRGVIGEDYIYGNDFYHEDNELTITFDDGSTQTYICKDVPMQDGGFYVGYFLNGNTSGNELNGLHEVVENESGLFVEGQNYFRIVAYVNETEVSTALIPATGYVAPDDPPFDDEEEKEKADAAIHDSEEAIASAKTEDGKASDQASAAEATAATEQPDDSVIAGAVSAGDAAVQAAQEAYDVAQKALAAAKSAYGEGSTQALAAETMVAAAKTLLASTTKSKATAANAAAASAGKKAAAANAAAAAQASAGTDAAVAAAQNAVNAANSAKTAADKAVAAAEEAVAAAEATGDEAAKEAAGKALDAAKAAQSSAVSAVTAANSTLAAATAAKNAAIAAAVAATAPVEIIDLPTVKISKPAAAKKKITVKWKKISKKNQKKISGIQIQVATDPGFTNIVKTATAGKKKTSKVIKGLRPKTKYYVRIRAYAAGDHYSVWKSKSAKVK